MGRKGWAGSGTDQSLPGLQEQWAVTGEAKLAEIKPGEIAQNQNQPKHLRGVAISPRQAPVAEAVGVRMEAKSSGAREGPKNSA